MLGLVGVAVGAVVLCGLCRLDRALPDETVAAAAAKRSTA